VSRVSPAEAGSSQRRIQPMVELTGVLVMAYGTPATLDDVAAYYTHIRRGRAPTPELLEQLTNRYRAIGGSSPLLDISLGQASGLQQLLGDAFQVRLGCKHAPPFIEDAVADLAGAGASRAVGLVLAPHYSALSVGEYIDRARTAAGDRLELDFIEQWHLAPGYVSLLASRVRDGLGGFPAERRDEVAVVFSAHSLPTRIVAAGDPYPAQLLETAQAVALEAGLPHCSTAWQSAGRTEEPWLGPDILTVVDSLAARGARGLLVCPAGFVSDHLEIVYDLDIECRARADAAGLPFARTQSPNTDPAFLCTLADVVLAKVRSVSA